MVREIKELHAQGRPILVGTISVETSEMLGRMLKTAGIPTRAQRQIPPAGSRDCHPRRATGAVTIATNMAGRGTRHQTGPGVGGGGLHVLGTERHESRRIDRQLRGTLLPSGDPGSSHFFISLEDDLMRLFGSDRISNIMVRMGLEEGQELEHPLLNRSIEQAQKRSRGTTSRSASARSNSTTMNKQRRSSMASRNEIIQSDDVRDHPHGYHGGGRPIEGAGVLGCRAIRQNGTSGLFGLIST